MNNLHICNESKIPVWTDKISLGNFAWVSKPPPFCTCSERLAYQSYEDLRHSFYKLIKNYDILEDFTAELINLVDSGADGDTLRVWLKEKRRRNG